MLQTGRPVTQIAQEMDINKGALHNWVNAWKLNNPEPSKDLSPMESAAVAEMETEIRRLRMENEFLKKSGGLLRQDATVAEKAALIDAQKANHPIIWMCQMLNVSRSSFYAWRGHVHRAATTRRGELAALITAAFNDSRQTYGCRHITVMLNRGGHACSVGLVADLMSELELKAVQPRSYRITTIVGDKRADIEDGINRNFTSMDPGTRLVGDITYLRTDQGWLYLAVVLDLARRMIIGWQITTHMRTSLITDALEMAHLHGYVAPGAIFHSDRGAQYTSSEFAKYLRISGIIASMGRTGVCWDNAAAESFFATLKNEIYYRHRFTTQARERFAVAEYIEVFYNRKRLHSTLGYQTPSDVLAHYYRATFAT